MQLVPLQPTPSQVVNCVLNGQYCQFNVYQRSTGLFIDVLVNDVLIIGGVVAYNYNFIVRDTYLGFFGDVLFADTQGNEDPSYTGLGTQWVLLYFLPSEVAAAQANLPAVITAGLQSMFTHDFTSDFTTDFS